MAYNAETFTALEQTTVDKMNKIWTNDAQFNESLKNGWYPLPDESWSYSSQNTYTNTNTTYEAIITVGSDATTRFSVGQKVKFSQTTDGVKYGIITKVSATQLTVFLGTDYDFDNEAISSIYIGWGIPFDFPMDKNKWLIKKVDTTLATQLTPTQNTWYNLGSISISLPVGYWDTAYQVIIQSNDTSRTQAKDEVTLSTANNSESDGEMTSYQEQSNSASGILNFATQCTRKKILDLSSVADIYYLNVRTTLGSIDGIFFRGDVGDTMIVARLDLL